MVDVVVVVPARDEEARIASCTRSVGRSLAHAVRTGAVDRGAIVVVGHRCLDDTLGRAQPELAGGRHALLAEAGATTVGEVRARGVRAAIDLLPYGARAARRGGVWVLSTDADTVVPLTWVVDVLRHACDGNTHAVVGMARLAGERLVTPHAHAAYRRIIEAGLRGREHDHVYGANLAVRADAYAAVGGFSPVVLGEDQALVDALAQQGFVVARPRDVVVATSGRRHGRAPGGLADLLARLDGLGDARVSGPRAGELSARPQVA